MRAFKIDQFKGITPRSPDHLIQPNEGTIAENCDLAYGQLQSLKGPLQYPAGTLAINAAALWSENGSSGYAGPVDADGVISPLQSGSARDRLYYTTDDDFRVTTRSGATSFGINQPQQSWRVGVPRPTVTPTIELAIPVEYTAAVAAQTSAQAARDAAQAVVDAATIARDAAAQDEAQKAIAASSYVNPGGEGGSSSADEAAIVAHNASVVVLAQKQAALDAAQADLTEKNRSLVAAKAAIGPITTETRAYVFTYVNVWGEEGPPSAPVVVDVKHGSVNGVAGSLVITGHITLDAFGEYVPLDKVRVYRTQNNGGVSDDYYFVADLAASLAVNGVITQVDNVRSELLNETLISQNWYPPPVALRNLVSLGNGILAAGMGNIAMFSEPYKPWAWPPASTLTFAHDLMGVALHGSGALVTTVGPPCLVSGITPDAMTQTSLGLPQAGVSKWSILAMDGYIAYASRDGIVLVNGGQGSLSLSEKFFTRKVWNERYGAALGSMQFIYNDGCLIVFSRTQSFTPFMIRLDEARGSMTTMPGFAANAAFAIESAGGMFYSYGTDLFKFAGGADLPLHWRSSDMVLPAPQCFGMAQAECIGTFTVKFYTGMEKTLRHTEVIESTNKTFRLPSGFESDRWQIDIAGTGIFKWIKVGIKGIDLAGV